jgi:alpha-galactosidase
VHIGNQGEFFHRYIIGLYDILGRIFNPRPHVLLESCSSGGNRFDLGMLFYSPQVWASDNTDPIERLKIQEGLSHLYPLSSIGSHISEAPHIQTLRSTTITTRFNVSSFGCLGIEMDLKYLSYRERKEIKEQLAFYKAHRRIFQYGKFSRITPQKDNKYIWQCTSKDNKEAVSGFFQTMIHASEGYDFMPIRHMKKNEKYTVKTRAQCLFIDRFDGLIKHILPITLNPEGILLKLVGNYYCLTDSVESYKANGDTLRHGIKLNNQFIGSGYNEKVRMMGDFGSNLYVTKIAK